jgi:hypothetical protein
MALPTGYKIMAKGYEIAGDVRTGMSATVPFIMPWSLAFTFISELLPAPYAPSASSITWQPPYQLPISLTGRPTPPLYCQSYRCIPCGYDGTPATESGLVPGDFFSTALVTADFATPPMIQQMGDDPSNLNQLDPDNPITACEQQVSITSKIVTQKGTGYSYTGGAFAGKLVLGEIGLVQPEVKLVLKFPRIPMLPWKLIQPYIGKVNYTNILGCVDGSLLLEGIITVVTPGTDGSLQQNLGLSFAFNPDPTGTSSMGMDWNTFPCPDGTYALIEAVGGDNPTPYSYANFANIFTAIQF